MVAFLFLGNILFWKSQQKIVECQDVVESPFPEEIPEELSIIKGDDGYFEIINKEDNYSFVLPKDWKKIKKINYNLASIGDCVVSSIFLEGGIGSQQITLNKFENNDLGINIKDWSDKLFKEIQFNGDTGEGVVGDLEVVIGKENDIEPIFFLFLKESGVYSITYEHMADIEEMILNGKW